MNECKCSRIASVYGKTSDCCVFAHNGKGDGGYVPKGVGIGGGDDITFIYCLDCGKIQSTEFPIPQEAVDLALSGG